MFSTAFPHPVTLVDTNPYGGDGEPWAKRAVGGRALPRNAVVPNLERKAKSGKFLAEFAAGDCGFRNFELSKCRLAW
jgi:hypothetical protein